MCSLLHSLHEFLPIYTLDTQIRDHSSCECIATEFCPQLWHFQNRIGALFASIADVPVNTEELVRNKKIVSNSLKPLTTHVGITRNHREG